MKQSVILISIAVFLCFILTLFTLRRETYTENKSQVGSFLQSIGVVDPNTILIPERDISIFQKRVQNSLSEHAQPVTSNSIDVNGDLKSRIVNIPDSKPKIINPTLARDVPQKPELVYTPVGPYDQVVPHNALLNEKPADFTSEKTRTFDYFMCTSCQPVS